MALFYLEILVKVVHATTFESISQQLISGGIFESAVLWTAFVNVALLDCETSGASLPVFCKRFTPMYNSRHDKLLEAKENK